MEGKGRVEKEKVEHGRERSSMEGKGRVEKEKVEYGRER